MIFLSSWRYALKWHFFYISNSFKSVEDEAILIYWKTEQMCQKYTNIFFHYPYAHLSLFCPSLITAIYGILVGKYDVESWQLPFILALPFDTTVFWGWCLEWLMQFNMAVGYSLSTVSTSSYFISGCLYVIAICDHFELLINSVSHEVDRLREKNNLQQQQSISRNIHERFVKAVVIHVKALEWVEIEFVFSLSLNLSL